MRMTDDQRLILDEIAASYVIFNELRDHFRHGNRITFVHLTLTLDMDDGASVVSVEIPDVDAGHLASAESISQHQCNDQFIPFARYGRGVDGIHKSCSLLLRQGGFVVFFVFDTVLIPVPISSQ